MSKFKQAADQPAPSPAADTATQRGGPARTVMSPPQFHWGPLLCIDEVAELAKVCQATVRNLIDQGVFPPPLKLAARPTRTTPARWLASEVEAAIMKLAERRYLSEDKTSQGVVQLQVSAMPIESSSKDATPVCAQKVQRPDPFFVSKRDRVFRAKLDRRK